MHVCPGCQRHVRLDESSCPFCATTLVTVRAPHPASAALLAISLGFAGLACAERSTSDTNASASASTGTGTSDGESEDGSESDTVSDTSTTTSTTTTMGDGDGDETNDDWQEEAAAYAGPGDWEEEEQEWGDGDGDSGDGDGDGEVPCSEFGAEPLTIGANDVFVVDGPSLLESSCGAGGPEAVYTFEAPADAFYEFALTSADFEAAIYLAGEVCDPLTELACDLGAEPLSLGLSAGTSVTVVIDSFAGGGVGVLEVSP